jgi:2-dehydropantoate 2-reductase
LPQPRGSSCRATSRDRHARFAEGLGPTGYSSLYEDLSNRRRMELEALHGMIVQSGRQHSIRVPVSETIYAILKPWAVRIEAATTL